VRKRNLEILSEARAETAPGFLRFATGGQCMQFQKSQSGNPAGRPRGSRNKASIRMRELLEQKAGLPCSAPVIFGRFPAFARLFADFASRAPPLQGFTGKSDPTSARRINL
jgi:Family of unknown function (DUF5681)